MSRVAFTYGANAVPAMGGSADSTRRSAVGGAMPAIGSGASLPTEPPPPPPSTRPSCAGITKRGSECGAPPVKGTEWCAGHLRSVEKDA